MTAAPTRESRRRSGHGRLLPGCRRRIGHAGISGSPGRPRASGRAPPGAGRALPVVQSLDASNPTPRPRRLAAGRPRLSGKRMMLRTTWEGVRPLMGSDADSSARERGSSRTPASPAARGRRRRSSSAPSRGRPARARTSFPRAGAVRIMAAMTNKPSPLTRMPMTYSAPNPLSPSASSTPLAIPVTTHAPATTRIVAESCGAGRTASRRIRSEAAVNRNAALYE